MWIQCVPLLQAMTLIHYAVRRLQDGGFYGMAQTAACTLVSYPDLYNHSALDLTIQAIVHSAGPDDHRFRDHRRLNKTYFIQPPANLPQTVYSQCALLSGVCLWQPDSMPHLPVQSHERLASSDSSSQHTALSRSAFSSAAVSCTTSGDKRLPECLACRRFTRTQG
ncbi:hypothetical protein CesoFtcFv8_007254 [Champsocephalus esox]|uniref:Uncharacterized protein n=1 Tax=Champsocephalus esox TaxID=159716 RepID=A0AAN8CDN7_9TELE|nr:hypothetical protein CesoFtcFv8_007254 [Champsocephalus esox]